MTTATVWRWQAFGMSVVCFAVAATIIVLGGEDFVHLLRGFSERRPTIASAHYLFVGLLLAPMVVGVAVIFLVSKPATPDQMKNASAQSMTRGGRYLIFAAASIVAALLSPIVQYWTVDYLARQRGYVACPVPVWPRHQPDRWALPGPHGGTGNCPGNGADPNL